jgi:hypothetical protein
MLDTRRRTNWWPVASRLVEAILPPEVIANCRETPAEDMHSDEMGFLERAMIGSSTTLSDLLPLLVDRFWSQFKSVRGFHGCRPVSLEPYLRDGLVPLSRELLEQLAIVSAEGRFSPSQLKAMVAKSELGTRPGEIFFSTDPRAQIAEYGHYLIDGPESLSCVFKGSGFHDRRERQRTLGIPTMIECAVPKELLSIELRTDLVRHLITGYFRQTSQLPSEDQWTNDWVVRIESPLPAANILGHFHPSEIYDVHGYGTPYKSPATRCRWCTT